MSNYIRVAWNPKERVARAAQFADNYFGPYEYGVMFAGDPTVYKPNEVEIPINLTLVPQALYQIEERSDTTDPQVDPSA